MKCVTRGSNIPRRQFILLVNAVQHIVVPRGGTEGGNYGLLSNAETPSTTGSLPVAMT
jgi:hypothetical protein